MKLECSTVSVCFNFSTSFRNDDFSSFKNYTKGRQDCRLDYQPLFERAAETEPSKTAAKKWHTKFKTKTSQLIVRKCNESQARSPSYLFTGKSDQNITTIKPFPPESTQGDDVMSSCCSWRSALWLNAMHSGKRWRIREFVPLLHILLKSWLCCCSLASLAPQQLVRANCLVGFHKLLFVCREQYSPT